MHRDVETVLNYYSDPGDGSEPTPVYVGQGTVANERKMEEVRVTVHDITGNESEFTLDKTGFQLVTKPTNATACIADNFENVDLIKSKYFPDTVDLLKEVTGATRVFSFDHKVRRGPADWHSRGQGNASQRGPLHRVHVDQSYDGAEFLVKWFLPDEADTLLRRRWQIINVSFYLLAFFSPLRLICSVSLTFAGLAPPTHSHERPVGRCRRPFYRRYRSCRGASCLSGSYTKDVDGQGTSSSVSTAQMALQVSTNKRRSYAHQVLRLRKQRSSGETCATLGIQRQGV